MSCWEGRPIPDFDTVIQMEGQHYSPLPFFPLSLLDMSQVPGDCGASHRVQHSSGSCLERQGVSWLLTVFWHPDLKTSNEPGQVRTGKRFFFVSMDSC